MQYLDDSSDVHPLELKINILEVMAVLVVKDKRYRRQLVVRIDQFLDKYADKIAERVMFYPQRDASLNERVVKVF